MPGQRLSIALLLVAAWAMVIAAGCASRRTFPDQAASSARSLSAITAQAALVASDGALADADRHARLRYLASLHKVVKRADLLRLDASRERMSRADHAAIAAALDTVYAHARAMAAWPGMLDERGEPVGTTPTFGEPSPLDAVSGRLR